MRFDMPDQPGETSSRLGVSLSDVVYARRAQVYFFSFKWCSGYRQASILGLTKLFRAPGADAGDVGVVIDKPRGIDIGKGALDRSPARAPIWSFSSSG